jgi:acyl carrier protein
VATIIEEILGISEIAADENFFEVGGNSILALTLMTRIEELWGPALSLIDVMHNATPALLADRIAIDAAGEPRP